MLLMRVLMMKRQKKITKYSNIGKLQDGTSYGLDETQGN